MSVLCTKTSRYLKLASFQKFFVKMNHNAPTNELLWFSNKLLEDLKLSEPHPYIFPAFCVWVLSIYAHVQNAEKMRNLSCTSIAGRLSLHTRSSRLIFLGELDILGKFLLIFVRTNLQSQIWAQTGGFRYGLCLRKKVGRRLIQKIKLETFSQKSPLARKILLLIFAVGRRSDKKKGRVKISTTHISSNNSLCVCYCRNLWRRIIFTLQVWHSSDSYNIQEKHSRYPRETFKDKNEKIILCNAL